MTLLCVVGIGVRAGRNAVDRLRLAVQRSVQAGR